MRSPETSPRLLAFLCLALILAAPFAGPWRSARAGSTAVLSVGAVPAQPTVCDSVTIGVGGALPNSCYRIESAAITGPEPPNPLCEAIECPSRFEVRITVRAPDPASEVVCPDVVQPYREAFLVGPLAAGAYAVRAVEVVLPAVGSSGTAPESTEVSTLFFVQQTTTCPPGGSCVILGIAPAPSMPVPPGLCTTAARPGGQATFALALHNEAPVAGVQTGIAIYDLRLDPGPNGPLPGGTFTPKSVEAVGRASGFQVDWTADGGALKAILFSTSGAAIPPGDGAILRITYGVGAETPLGSYAIVHFNDIVSDPEGNALPFCPTLRETSGWLCVVGGACDVNGDGASDIRDIVGIVRCALAAGGAGACPDSIAMRADCNGDGSVDVRDVICCVRKILATRLDSLGATTGTPQAGPGPSISFLGDVTWTTPVEGVVGIRISPDARAAGVEWVLDPSAPSVRVNDLRVVSGGEGVHLEWSADGSGHASAMLYSENGAPLGHDVTLELSLDRVIGSAGPASIHITAPLASGSDGAAEAVSSDRAEAAVTATGVAAPAVYPARPNPFVGSSEITFALPQAARATLRVFDVHGRLVRTLVDGPRAAGVYHEQWDGRSDDGRPVSSGIYLLSFRAGGVAHTQRLLRLR